MQKKLKSSLIVASFVVAAAIVFIACGSGELEEISTKIPDINASHNSLVEKGGKIEECEMFYTSECEGWGQQSYSSVAAEPSSSSNQDEPVSSSSQTQRSSSSTPLQPSSSSTPPGQSSSSATPPPPPSSSSAARSSAAAATGCEASNPKSGFTCGWKNITGTLVPGQKLEPTSTGKGDCEIEWKYKDGTFGDCLQTSDAGFTAVASAKYFLYATLTCSDGKHTTNCTPDGLSAKRAPYLEGTCDWKKNPTTTARGGEPVDGLVTIVDLDNVCGTTKSVVYKYDSGAKTWPATGILAEWKDWDKKHKETYNVDATLNCPAYPDAVTSPCPPLEVSAGTDYIIECTGKFDDASCGGAAKKTVILNLDECVEINVMGYTDQYNTPSLIMRCETQGTQASASVTMSLNGKSTTTTGSYSVQPLITLGKIALGDNEFGTLCLTAMSGATNVKCTGPSQ